MGIWEYGNVIIGTQDTQSVVDGVGVLFVDNGTGVDPGVGLHHRSDQEGVVAHQRVLVTPLACLRGPPAQLFCYAETKHKLFSYLKNTSADGLYQTKARREGYINADNIRLYRAFHGSFSVQVRNLRYQRTNFFKNWYNHFEFGEMMVGIVQYKNPKKN